MSPLSLIFIMFVSWSSICIAY